MTVPCYACHRLDPHCCAAQVASPFAILGVQPTLALGAEGLEEAFHRLIQQVHPDVFKAKNPSPSLTPEDVNQAYHDLLAPYTRALALYERATGQTVPTVTHDPEVLAWALDLEDAPPQERRYVQQALWNDLLSEEQNQNWDGFLKTLLRYRYTQEKA
jgi:curved DNA-binding protein CbpA